MAQAAVTEFRKQKESVRREAFTAGYAAAVNKVKALTARAAPKRGDGEKPSVNGLSKGHGRTDTPPAAPKSPPVGRRRNPRPNGLSAGGAARSRRSRGRSQRGTNAVLISEVLKAAAPRALRQAEIRRALQDKGKTMSFPSIGYSLRQLTARNALKQGSGKSWRYQKA